MPIRVLVTLIVLLAVTAAVLAIAWISQSELYFFLPSVDSGYGVRLEPPPTHPGSLLFLLIISLVVAIYSRHYGLVVFTIFPIGLLLGSGVGFVAFEWTPSLCQHLLTVSAVVAAGYGWSKRLYLDY